MKAGDASFRTPMRFNAEQYRAAADDRLKEAQILHRHGRFSGALYEAGVAVECLLRAYASRRGAAADFDARHDLQAMLRQSGILDLARLQEDGDDRREMAALLGDVWSRWKNNYRYASDDRLRAELKTLGLDRGIQGDCLKENSRRALSAAFKLFAVGVKRWNSSTS